MNMVPDDTDGDDADSGIEDRTVVELRRDIRHRLGGGDADAGFGSLSRNLRRAEIAEIYERLSGKKLPLDAAVPEARYRVVDVLGGVENRDQFSSAYPFRRDELVAIDEALREAAPDENGDDPDVGEPANGVYPDEPGNHTSDTEE